MYQPVQHAAPYAGEAVEAIAQRQPEHPAGHDLNSQLQHCARYCQRMRTSTDVFAKARESERLELMRAARELDMVPYFRVLEGPTLPVVEMEGASRIMLGSNNYLGLTGDERVKQGALDALHRYGTGLTGSRFLNGTTDLHLELESELADWLGAEAVLVFTTGHQANLGALGTLLAPGDTVSRIRAITLRSSTGASSRARSCGRSGTAVSISSSGAFSRPPRTGAAC